MKRISTKVDSRKDYTFVIDDNGKLKGIKVEYGDNGREYYAVKPQNAENAINEEIVLEALTRLLTDKPQEFLGVVKSFDEVEVKNIAKKAISLLRTRYANIGQLVDKI